MQWLEVKVQGCWWFRARQLSVVLLSAFKAKHVGVAHPPKWVCASRCNACLRRNRSAFPGLQWQRRTSGLLYLFSNAKKSYPNSFLKANCSYEESGPCPIMKKSSIHV